MTSASFTEADESKWAAADHAEFALRRLMERVRALYATAVRHDDTETMTATSRSFGDFLGSVLWQRRDQIEHGGRMRSPPDQSIVAERDALRNEVQGLLASTTLTPAAFGHVVGILGGLMYAEFDGKMDAQRDVAMLFAVHAAWLGLGRLNAEGNAPDLLRYLSNTAISAINWDREGTVVEAVTLLQDMAGHQTIAPELITERTADAMADLCWALLFYQSSSPARAYAAVSSWQFLAGVSWRSAMLAKVTWPKLVELTVSAVTMLRAKDSGETPEAWSWLTDRLADPAQTTTRDINWWAIGNAIRLVLQDRHLSAPEAGALFAALQSRVQVGGPEAVGGVAESLANMAFDLPSAHALNQHDPEFLIALLESGLTTPDQVQLLTYALTALLVQYAFEGRWDVVDKALPRLSDPESGLAFAGTVVAYRTMSELVLMPDVGLRTTAYVQLATMPYTLAAEAPAVEAARRILIDNLLSDRDLSIHPKVFFPLLGLLSDE